MNIVEYKAFINREDLKKVEEEEANKFFYWIIESIGLDIEDVWPNPPNLSIEEKINLNKFLFKYQIEIIHDGDGGYKVYCDREVIGEWFKPRVILKQDPSALKLSQRLYFEVQFKYSSLFEEGEE